MNSTLERQETTIQPDRYLEARGRIGAVLQAQELGYIYAFPDKRLYTPVLDPQAFVEAAWGQYEGKISIYTHTPYCTPKPAPIEVQQAIKEQEIVPDGRDHLCGYCNLFTVVAKGVPQDYPDLMQKEIERYRPMFQGKHMEPTSLYFGGGSPSLMSPTQLKGIVDTIEDVVGKVPEDQEKAIECIPDSVDYEKLKGIREAGFNRVSIGVQTFDEGVLHYNGRHYDAKLGYQAVKDAKAIGFLNVNADIIIGLPSSTRDTFRGDIDTILELQPETVTLYQDMTRPVTRFGKMKQAAILPSVSQQDIYEWSAEGDQRLQADGYQRRSLTCWSKGSWGYQQGEDIYEGIPVIGFGAGARSYGPTAHYATEYTVSTRLTNLLIKQWGEAIANDQFPPLQGYAMGQDVQQRSRVVLGLMSLSGITAIEAAPFFPELAALEDSGMVTHTEGIWKYTPDGKAHSGALSTIFFGKEIEDNLQRYKHQ